VERRIASLTLAIFECSSALAAEKAGTDQKLHGHARAIAK
jgi:hypothetical protein